MRTGRIGKVQKLLQPFRGAGPPVPCQFVNIPRQPVQVIAAAQKTSSGYDYAQWTFPTSVKNIFGKYYESWSWVKERERFRLERCYLSVVRLDVVSRGYQAILCVHCDPTCTEVEPLKSFKSGPHLHVELADDPIPKCHFPLNLGHLKQVLSSEQEITTAMRSAVRVITEEVMPRYARL